MTADALAGCALALTSDDLSAWRDGALDGATTQRLDAHIATCAACRARIGDYDAIAQALRAIPTPELIGGYGRNPRFQTTAAQTPPQRRAPMRSRRTLGSLGAVAAVALIVLAFTQILGRLSVHPPTASATATATTASSTVAPTATIPTVPALPNLRTVPAATAWGNTGLVKHIASTQLSDTQNFVPLALTPDGATLVGEIHHYTPSDSSRLALWTVATGKVTLLNYSGAPVGGFGSVSTDGRYVVFSDPTCQACDSIFVYDLSAGAVVRQIHVIHGSYPEVFDHGLLVAQSPFGGIEIVNVATGLSRAFPDSTAVMSRALVLAFSWPYIVYMPDPSATTLPGALAVRDLATGQQGNLAPLTPLLPDLLSRLKDNGNPAVAVTDGALFVVTTLAQMAPSAYISQMYELDDFMSASPRLKPLARITTAYQNAVILHGANARVVGMFVSGFNPIVYDRALGVGVQFTSHALSTVVSGRFVSLAGAVNGHVFDPYDVIIYDTNKLSSP